MDIIDIFVIGIYVFTGIIVILSAILIFLYRNKKGLFDNKEETSVNIIGIEPEEKTKEELIDELYNEYNNGKITENELNNRLRRIWWSEDD